MWSCKGQSRIPDKNTMQEALELQKQKYYWPLHTPEQVERIYFGSKDNCINHYFNCKFCKFSQKKIANFVN